MSSETDKSTRRTKIIVLTIVGAGLGLTIYNIAKPSAPTTETRNVYANREDCVAATNDPAQCEPSQGRGGYGHGSYFGPIFFPGGFGSNRQPPVAGAPPAAGAPPVAGARPAPAPIGQFHSSRGGFGGSSGGYHSGS